MATSFHDVSSAMCSDIILIGFSYYFMTNVYWNIVDE